MNEKLEASVTMLPDPNASDAVKSISLGSSGLFPRKLSPPALSRDNDEGRAMTSDLPEIPRKYMTSEAKQKRAAETIDTALHANRDFMSSFR